MDHHRLIGSSSSNYYHISENPSSQNINLSSGIVNVDSTKKHLLPMGRMEEQLMDTFHSSIGFGGRTLHPTDFSDGNMQLFPKDGSEMERPRPASAREMHPLHPSIGMMASLPYGMIQDDASNASVNPMYSLSTHSGYNVPQPVAPSQPGILHKRAQSNDFLFGYPGSKLNQNEENPLLYKAADRATLNKTDFGTSSGSGLLSGIQASSSANIMHLASTQRSVSRLQQELDVTKDKLNSCMNSIKTFWSPELKKERAARKEENVKHKLLADHLHQIQLEKQNMLNTLHCLESELRNEREMRAKNNAGGQELQLLQHRCEELHKENMILVRQQEEMETFSIGQKQALLHQEESIRRLMEMLKGKLGSGRGVERIEEDRMEIERLRVHIQEYSVKCIELEKQLLERETYSAKAKEDVSTALEEINNLKRDNELLRHESRQMQSQKAILDTKDAKILALESEIRLLENEVAHLHEREAGVAHIDAAEDHLLSGGNPMTTTMQDNVAGAGHLTATNDKSSRAKLEVLTNEISKRDAEIFTLQNKMEMVERQLQDQVYHVNILKEQVKARDHKINMLMSDIEDNDKRQKEKDSTFEKKSKLLVTLQNEKRQLEKDLNEIREQMDLKDRKLTLLQKKVESLEDMLTEKDTQLSSVKSRLSEQSSTEGNRTGWEERLREKDRLLERIKEQKTRQERDYQEELDNLRKSLNEMRTRYESGQRELDEKKMSLLQLREEMSQLKAAKFKRETEYNQLQNQVMQKSSDLSSAQMELQMVKKQHATESEFKSNQRILELESQVNHYREQSMKAQSEVDRIMQQMRLLEKEKNDRDRNIRDLEENISSLKRTHESERRKQMQILEDIRRREENSTVDSEIFKSTIEEKEARIRELTQALKESVKITAEREVFLVGREELHRHQENQIVDLKHTVEALQKERNTLTAKLSHLRDELREKESKFGHFFTAEGEKLMQVYQESNKRVSALLKILQNKDSQLLEDEKTALQSLSIFYDYTSNSWKMLSAGNLPHGKTVVLQPIMPAYLMPSNTSAFQVYNSSDNNSSRQNAEECARLSRMLVERDHSITQLKEEIFQLKSTLSGMASRGQVMLKEGSSYIMTGGGGGGGGVGQLTQPSELLNQENEKLKHEKSEVNELLIQATREVRTKSEKISRLETDLARVKTESDRLQKKYQAVLSQLSDRRDRDRFHQHHSSTSKESDSHQTELKLLREEVEDLKHRHNYLEKYSQEKEMKIAQLEKDVSKYRDDYAKARKKLSTHDTEVKRLKVEIGFKEENIKELTVNHTNELNRMRDKVQDGENRLMEMKQTMDERDKAMKVLSSQKEKMQLDMDHCRRKMREAKADADRWKKEFDRKEQKIKDMECAHFEESDRCIKATENVNNLLKRVEEREQRLRKIEQENHGLLDEIQQLRCRMNEIDNYSDCTKHDFGEKLDENTSRSSSIMDVASSSQMYLVDSYELDRLRRQLSKVSEDSARMQKLLVDAQTHNERLVHDYDMLQSQMLDDKSTLKKYQALMEKQDVENEKLRNEMNRLKIEENSRIFLQTQQFQEKLTNLEKQHSSHIMEIQCKIELKDAELFRLNQLVLSLQNQLSHIQQRRMLDNAENVAVTANAREHQNQLQNFCQDLQEIDQAKMNEIDKLQNDLEKASDRISYLENQLKDKVCKLEEAYKDCASLKQQLFDRRQPMSSLDSDDNDCTREREQSTLMSKVNVLTKENSSLHSELQQQQEKHRTLELRLSAAVKEEERSKEAILELKSNLHEKQKELEETQSRLRDWCRSNEEKATDNNEADNLRNELMHKDNLIADLKTETSRLKKDKDLFVSRQQELQQQWEIEWKKLEERKKAEVDELRGKVSEMSAAANRSTRDLENKSTEMETFMKEMVQCKADLHREQNDSQEIKNRLKMIHEKEQVVVQERDRLQTWAQQLEGTLKMKEAELQQSQKDLHHNKQALHQLQQSIAKSSEDEGVRSRELISTIQQELEDTRAALKQSLQDKENLLDQLESLRGDQKKLNSLNSQMQEIGSILNQRNRDFDMKVAETVKLQNELNSMTVNYDNLCKEYERMRHELDSAVSKEEYLKLENCMQQMAVHMEERDQEVQILRAEMQQAKTQQERTAEMENDYETHINNLEEQLEQKNDQLETLKEQMKQMETALAAKNEERRQSQSTSHSDVPKLDHVPAPSAEFHDLQQKLLDLNEEMKFQEDCIKNQTDEINQLRQELQRRGHEPNQANAEADESSRSNKIYALQEEISQCYATIQILQAECNENHVNKIDALQNEVNSFSRNCQRLTEQNSELQQLVEEKNKIIQDMQQNIPLAPGASGEENHAMYEVKIGELMQELENKSGHIKIMENQLEHQLEELLQARQEALTASLCEKDANIALIQISGGKSAQANQAMNSMQRERQQIQAQLTQLCEARAKMREQKK